MPHASAPGPGARVVRAEGRVRGGGAAGRGTAHAHRRAAGEIPAAAGDEVRAGYVL